MTILIVGIGPDMATAGSATKDFENVLRQVIQQAGGKVYDNIWPEEGLHQKAKIPIGVRFCLEDLARVNKGIAALVVPSEE